MIEIKLCIVIIGERPGLSSPDSMGIYFTYQAKSGLSTDADRNCISNIHANGLSYEKALKKLLFLIHEAEIKKYSGVNLKDETTDLNVNDLQQKNFLHKSIKKRAFFFQPLDKTLILTDNI